MAGTEFLYMLAPMEDLTNSTFRTLCHKYGADLTFTELVRLESLVKRNENVLDRISIADGTPTAIQVVGAKDASLKEFLSSYSPEPGFSGINLNLGCPNPKIVQKGWGCALIKRMHHVQKLVSIIKSHGYEASVKLRLGMNQHEKERKVYLNLIKNVDADFFVVHARHGRQSYSEPADWSIFPECCRTGKRIIANGDVKTLEDVSLLKSYGCSGVMIGREAVKNPGIFGTLKGLKVPLPAEIKKEYLERSSNDEVFRYRKNLMKHIGEESPDIKEF
jgi:tRNA-dihydrouridine synthase B